MKVPRDSNRRPPDSSLMTRRGWMVRMAAGVSVAAALAWPEVSLAAKAKPKKTDKSRPSPQPAQLPTLAVLYFDTHTPPEHELYVLRKGLAQMLISDLGVLEGVTIVERDRLEALIVEQKLQHSAAFDASTAVRVGKLLGARFLVLGSVLKLGAAIRIDARVVEVETGSIVFAAGVSGKGDDFFGLEGQLADRLRTELIARRPALAVPPATATQRPKKRILRRPKALSIETAGRYAKALDAKDRGDKAGAQTGLAAVVREAPDFELAYIDLQSMTN